LTIGWLPSGQGSGYLTLRRRFDLQPFTSPDAARALGLRPDIANVVVSRLTRSGWLLRLGRGTFVLMDPEVMMTPDLAERLAPFRSRCFFPVLQRAVGEVLRVYSGRLMALAFVSPRRGDRDANGTGLELLAVVERLPEDAVERSVETGFIGKAVSGLMGSDWRRNRHLHPVQVRSVTPAGLRRPGSFLLAASRFTKVLWDPERRLRSISGTSPRSSRRSRDPRRMPRPPRQTDSRLSSRKGRPRRSGPRSNSRLSSAGPTRRRGTYRN